jgi:hypothetical protein
MSDTEETLNLDPADTGDQGEESEVELEVELPEGEEAEVDGGDDEEIDIRGQKRKLKEVAEILAKADNLQRDYTKDKMALADERREIERVKQEAESLAVQRREVLNKIGDSIGVLNDELSELEAINWDAVRAEYPEQFADLWAAANVKFASLNQEKQKREMQRRELVGQRDSEEINQLVKSIPELATAETRIEYAKKMQSYADQFGVSVTNSAIGKMVSKAMKDAEDAEKYRAAVAKAKAKARPNAVSNAPEPPAPVRSSSGTSSTKLSDDLSVDEWIKRRNAQLKRR